MQIGVFALLLVHPAGAQADAGAGAGGKPIQLPASRSFFSFFSLNVGFSVLYFPADMTDLTYDLDPILPSPHLGIGIPFAFPGTSVFSFEFSYDGYFTNYLVPSRPAPQRPFPAAVENRSTFVLGNMAGIHLQGKSEFAHFLSLRYSAGIAFDIRFITPALDLNDGDTIDSESDTAIIKDYFNSENRFVFPTAGLGLDFRTSPGMSFGFEARVWLPVYRWQTGEDLPPLEGWRFGLCFRATFLHETPDKKIDTDLDKIKERFQTTRNDYAFLLYYLVNNMPPGGISPEELSAAVLKTYRRSRLYTDERRGLSPAVVVNMFADVPEASAVYDYDPMGAVIKRK